jgi:CRP-like cAMP-binding protein
MGDVVALHKHSRTTREQAEQVRQFVLALDIPEGVRAHTDNVPYRFLETPGRRWLFVMINPDQFRFVSKAIRNVRKAELTFAVWNAAVTYVRMDTGEITASRDQLAEDAGTSPDEVSRAMGELTRIGAIVRHRRGRYVAYFVNPNVGWSGGERARRGSAKDTPQLRLVMSGES